jgi:uncharacterized protein involved in response to NO
MAAPLRTLLGYAFRPFFLLGAAWAIVAVLTWVALLHGWLRPAPAGDPALWHAHEMAIGFGGAAVAGFLLTAVATWTGRPPVAGPALALLVATWCAGRAAMAAPWLPPGLVALADLAFPLLLAGLAAREVVAGGSRRNYGIVAGLAAFVLLDAAFHAGRAGLLPGADRAATNLAVHALVLLITVIGGRIVPSFTANWLRQQGAVALPRSHAPVEALVLPLTAAAALAEVARAPAALVAAAAAAAALAHAARLAGWRGGATVRNPLLAILHVAYAWLPLGYGLLAVAAATGLPPRAAALHALTIGGVGMMVLAVAGRVALGHTGRPLAASAPTVAAYVLLNAAALVRVAGAALPAAGLAAVDLAAAAWAAAFVLFLWAYAPMLTAPRAGTGA